MLRTFKDTMPQKENDGSHAPIFKWCEKVLMLGLLTSAWWKLR